MAIIKEFKNYLQEIQDEITGINKNHLIVEETQLTRYINDHYPGDNALLLGLLPNFGNNSPQDADRLRLRAFTEVMLVAKTDYSELTETELVEQYDHLYDLMVKVKNKLIDDHTNQTCNFLRLLDPTSIQIVEIYHLAQCNGWTMAFSFDVL